MFSFLSSLSRVSAADSVPEVPSSTPVVKSASAVSSPSGAGGAGEKTEPENGFSVSREEVGRSTWTLLHSIASYYPDNPTRQQQKDVKNFVDCLSRLYPCEICANHFQEIVKSHPPQCSSSRELQQWTCDVHNTVNRSLKKPTFNCSFLQARWGAVDCGTNGSCRVHYRDAQRSLRNAR